MSRMYPTKNKDFIIKIRFLNIGGVNINMLINNYSCLYFHREVNDH